MGQSALPELKEQEAALEHHREEIRKEAEAMLAEEQGSRGSSFAEEIQNMIAGEDDFPDVVEIKGKIASIKSNIADLNLIFDETSIPQERGSPSTTCSSGTCAA